MKLCQIQEKLANLLLSNNRGYYKEWGLTTNEFQRIFLWGKIFLNLGWGHGYMDSVFIEKLSGSLNI
jgi:hypothetical protein